MTKLHLAMTKKKLGDLKFFFCSGSQNGRCVKKAYNLGPVHMVVRAELELEGSESKFRCLSHLLIA